MKKIKLKKKWKIILIIFVVVFIIFSSLKIGTLGLKVREYKIVNENLSSFYGFKIVHFSDLLYGNGVDKKKLNKLVNMINDTKPDIVIFSGDLISNKTKITNELIELLTNNLKKINSNYGKFYVSGDIDKNNKSFNTIMSNSDFIDIEDKYENIYSRENKKIFITGLDINKSLSNDVIEKLNLDEINYKILVSHYPDKVDEILKYNFDLVLCGHSLNGQIKVPVIGKIYTPNNAKKYYDSYYKIDNTNIYISNGIGTHKINLRLFNTPSFNLYRLVDK